MCSSDLLSYSCADWIPFVSPSEIENAAKDSFADALRFHAQQHACTLWNVPAMPRNFNEPVRSSTPVLMIEGSDDPATPPRDAQAELPYLTNAKLIVVQGAGHAEELPCTDRLIVQFIRSGVTADLGASSCENSFKRPPFATSD